MDLLHILSLLGGVAFFLYGMSAMGSGLKKVAGPKMEAYLWKLSDKPGKGFLLGLLTAAVIQSSSATSVMVVSFVNAGMMQLAQAVSVVLGSQVGTTMTGWLLTLSQAGEGSDNALAQLLSTAALYSILAVVGIVFILFLKKRTLQSIGSILLGLGTLLLAMTLIGSAVSPLKESESFRNILLLFENPVLGILAGFVVGGVVQSASAGVGILQALCVTGSLPYAVCLPLILGINLGAAVPVLLSMIGGTRAGKRTSLTYFFSNLFSIFITYIIYLPLQLTPLGDFFQNTPATVMGIAVMNTGLRLLVAPFLMVFHKLLIRLVERLVKIRPEENEDKEEVDSLVDSLLNYPPMALAKAQVATEKMAEITQKTLLRAMELTQEFDRDGFAFVQEKESLADTYEDKLGNFIVRISKHSLTSAQQAQTSELLSAIGDFERMSDHSLNIAESALEIFEKKVTFSPAAEKEIKYLFSAVQEILDTTVIAFQEQEAQLARRVEPLEEVIDEMTKLLRAAHIERLQKNECTIVAGFVFNDLLTNLERVADHCSNIAFSVLHSTDLSAEAHVYAENVAGTEAFQSRYNAYREMYLDPIS